MRLTVRGTLRFVGVIVDQNVRCRTASTPVLTIRCDVAFWPGATDVVLQHGVIPGSSQTRAQGISSPGTYEASLMGPRNDGERQWNIMLDWTCR